MIETPYLVAIATIDVHIECRNTHTYTHSGQDASACIVHMHRSSESNVGVGMDMSKMPIIGFDTLILLRVSMLVMPFVIVVSK